jgi:hypothetical protein
MKLLGRVTGRLWNRSAQTSPKLKVDKTRGPTLKKSPRAFISKKYGTFVKKLILL